MVNDERHWLDGIDAAGVAAIAAEAGVTLVPGAAQHIAEQVALAGEEDEMQRLRARVAELEAANRLLTARLANANARTADARAQRDEVTRALMTTDYFPVPGVTQASVDELLGAAPDWTGGLSVDEHMARERDESEAP